jgi:hypothetical protein
VPEARHGGAPNAHISWMEIVMTDLLILLLSTDWFFPFWSRLGIQIDESTAIVVKNDCRRIIGEITNDLAHYYDSDLSPQRKEGTFIQFTVVLERLKVTGAFSSAISEWGNMTQDELTAAWTFTRLTDNLISESAGDGRPDLDPAIVARVKTVHDELAYEEPEFLDLCLTSRTSWDGRTRNLQPGLPTLLADTLVSFLRERQLRMLWDSLVQQLSGEQRKMLVTWYHNMAKFRGMRDTLVPNFIY